MERIVTLNSHAVQHFFEGGEDRSRPLLLEALHTLQQVAASLHQESRTGRNATPFLYTSFGSTAGSYGTGTLSVASSTTTNLTQDQDHDREQNHDNGGALATTSGHRYSENRIVRSESQARSTGNSGNVEPPPMRDAVALDALQVQNADPQQARMTVSVSATTRYCTASLIDGHISAELYTHEMYCRLFQLEVHQVDHATASPSSRITATAFRCIETFQTGAVLLYNLALTYHWTGLYTGISQMLCVAITLYDKSYENLWIAADFYPFAAFAIEFATVKAAVSYNRYQIYANLHRYDEAAAQVELLQNAVDVMEVHTSADEFQTALMEHQDEATLVFSNLLFFRLRLSFARMDGFRYAPSA